MTSIRLHYTEEIIRTAVARLWWRTLGLRFIVAFLLVGVSLAGDRKSTRLNSSHRL